MDNNGTHHNNGHQNGTSVATQSNVVTFPQNDDTRIEDISSLIHDAPVMGRAVEQTPAETAIASDEDFAQIDQEKPFYRRLGPKATAGAVLSALVILPLSIVFIGGGGGSKKTNEQQAVDLGATSEQTTAVTPEDYAAMQAELEQLRSQQAFTDQQVDADAIDEMGKQKQQQDAQTKTAAKPSTRTASRSTSSTTARSTPMPAARPSRVTTVNSRPPAPARATTPAPRPASIAASPQPSRVIQAPASAREVEPVDPFERRAQLQALGTYGAPPPTTQAGLSRATQAANPFESANPFIQAIAVEPPQAEPALSVTQATPIERPLTEEELQYQKDVDAVLAVEESEAQIEPEVTQPEASEAPVEDSAVIDLRGRMSEPSEDSQEVATSSSRQSAAASPMAIMPGTSADAELPYGFSWQEGMPLPEILLMTTEDIMAGDRSVIPSGTQFLGQAQVDPGSGAVNIQVVGIFGETRDIQIPRASVAVQAADGGVLTAKVSGGSSRSSEPNIGGFLMESLGNSVGNVLGNGDSVLEDIGGGVAETIIDDQIARSRTRASARNARSASQPIVWTLDARPVRLTFNNYIPLYSD